MKYEEYKDSGMEWIGEVPSHWEVMRMRFTCEFRNGYTPSKSNPAFWEKGTIPWYRMEDIRESGRFLNEAKQYITEEAVKGNGLFEAGSFILATTATIGEHALLIADSLANQQFTNLKIRKSLSDEILKEFFFYYLFVIDAYCKSTTRTATFPAVNMDDLKNFGVAFPSLSEQQAIATYLDEKCEKINTAIEVQKKKIELLEELKQSIITDAVTKGLNPNATMKDSGVEWIGEVPEHWEVCRIKNVLKNGSDSIKIGPFGSSLTGKVGENLGYKVYGQWNIIGCDFNAGTNTVDSETFKKLCKSYRVVGGDILISMMGTIGKCAVIPENIQDGIMDSHVVKIRLNRTKITTDFFEYFYDKDKSNVIYSQLQKVKGGSIMDGLNSSVIKNLTIVVPPVNEQIGIIKNIKDKIRNVEVQIYKANHRIELLEELKQSIITEAVTGKVKVF